MSSDALSLTLLNEPSAVPRTAEQVEAFCRDRNIAGPIAYKFNLALDETLTNAISVIACTNRRTGGNNARRCKDRIYATHSWHDIRNSP